MIKERESSDSVLSGIAQASPVDLLVAVALTAVVDLTLVLSGVTLGLLEVIFELIVLLFLPGYAFLAALFPRINPIVATIGNTTERETHVNFVERIALSFVLSVAIVALLGTILNYSPWGLRQFPIVIVVSGFVVVVSIAAAIRRSQVPANERFQVLVRHRLGSLRTHLVDHNSRLDGLINAVLILSIVLVVSSVVYAVETPASGERYTEFYLLSEDEDGTLVMDNYPSEFEQGESRPVVLAVRNKEYQAMNYTVVVELQEIRTENNSTTVTERRELDRLSTPNLNHNETWITEYSVSPSQTGKQLRLAFLLYRGEAPENPTVDSAYRETQLITNVTA